MAKTSSERPGVAAVALPVKCNTTPTRSHHLFDAPGSGWNWTEEGEAGETAEGDDVATDGTGEEAVVEEAEDLSSDEDSDVGADASTDSGTAPSTEAVALPL